MEKEVVITKRFRKNVYSIYEYLLKKFSPGIALKFLQRVEEKLDFIAEHPEIGKLSQKRVNVRSILFTPHNKIFYRVTNDKIEVLSIFDMRKDPKKNRY